MGVSENVKEWDVTVHFKHNAETSSYIFVGHREQARQDAYLSFPAGSILKVDAWPSDNSEDDGLIPL